MAREGQRRLTCGRRLSFDDFRLRTGRGGPRAGAGRPRGARSRVAHRERVEISGPLPAHVTLRLRRGLPSLRSRGFVRDFRRSLRSACERGEFRVLHYSLQRDHVHLLVEASSKDALGRGMKSIGARLARAVNRVFRRTGGVLDGRYHLRLLRTPREVRSALAYVLLNARRHWRKRFGAAPPVRHDEASSARWFAGWKTYPPGDEAPEETRRPQEAEEPELPEIAAPRTWLARTGWTRHGLLDPATIPGS